jgi:DNA processing protein
VSAEDEMMAWAYLSRVAEAPCAEMARLVEGVGPVEAAERIRRADVDDALVNSTDARRDIECAAEDLEHLKRRGGRLITLDLAHPSPVTQHVEVFG